MRRVALVFAVMTLVLAVTWVAAGAVGEVSPGWSLVPLLIGAVAQWGLYRRWGKPALDALVRDLNAADAADSGSSAPRRFGDLLPHGSTSSRGAWARRHPWLASIYFTLLFGVLVVVACLGMPPTARNVLLGAYVVIVPIAFRIGLAAQWYNEDITRPPR